MAQRKGHFYKIKDMRVGLLIVVAIATIDTFASSEIWKEDPRCPGYGRSNRRIFDPNEPDMRLFEGGVTERGKSIDGSNVAVMSNSKNFRGVNAISHHRRLNYIFNFQIKMYWEEGYCWQEEWDEREWCLECEGTACGQDDHLWLKRCDNSEDRQRFTYETVNDAIQAVKIKPLDHQDLCWTRTGTNEMQLKPCGDNFKDGEGRDLQVLIGFSKSVKFELHPNGQDETNPESFKCMNNHHHPKSFELIRADYCTTVRMNKTGQWMVFNAKGPGSVPAPAPSSGNGIDSRVVSMNNSYCTPEAPCPQCYGDCDTDNDCQGKLKCFQRNSGQKVPSCSGGENMLSATDICIDPNWEAAVEMAELTPLGAYYCSKNKKCSLCQGDCDSNADCEEGLICYQRDGGEDIPGCAGEDGSNTDYCIHPL